MPYQSCPKCGLRTYTVRGEECPRCGTPLGGLPSAATPDWTAAGEPPGPVEDALALARSELNMDAALLSEIRDGHEVVLWAVGDVRIPALVAGASVPLQNTICQQLLEGTADSIIHDAANEPRVRHLPVVREGLGAYIGVPIDVASARRYILCCLAREARADLSDADVRFLRGLVDRVRPAVERAAGTA